MQEKGGHVEQEQAPQHSMKHQRIDEADVPPKMGRLKFGDMYLELPVDKPHDANRKVLGVIGRELKDVHTDKPLFTFQQLADQLEYGDRQDVQNFHRELRQCTFDMERFLSRKATKHDRLFPLIEAAILDAPFLSLAQHYRQFCETHPRERLSETTFRKYANEIDGVKILKRVRGLVRLQDDGVDMSRYLEEVLQTNALTSVKKKEIVEHVPQLKEATASPASPPPLKVSQWAVQRRLLVVVLSVCGVPQAILAQLLGVGKTSIHTMIRGICDREVEWRVLREIVRWSGTVSFDEKWIKIAGEWWFVLCAVDGKTGFPLLLALYPALDAVSWTLFFQRFKALYGKPTLILSDGSRALAAARKLVFSGVRYQFCKFHKLRNLTKRLREHIRDRKQFIRCARLAKHLFANAYVSSRKAAAIRLRKLAGQDVAEYLDGHILTPWRHLTMSLTNNAAERFNRKIERCFSGRYGIPNPESATVLLRGLWLKELLFHGKKHCEATSEFRSIDWSAICQETLSSDQILHVFHERNPELLEKLG